MAYMVDLGFNPSSMTTKNVAVDTITALKYSPTGQTVDSVSETAVQSTLARPEVLSFGRRLIKDIYAGGTVERAYQAPSRTGIRLLVSLSTIASLTNSDDATFRMDFPLSVKTTVDLPCNDYFTADHVLTLIKHQTGAWFAGDTSVTATRIGELLRGTLPIQ